MPINKTINAIINDIDSLKNSLEKLTKGDFQNTFNFIELEEKLNFYTDICDKANILIHISDVNTKKLVWGNSKFKEMLGFTVEEITEMGFEYQKKYYNPNDVLTIEKAAEYFIKGLGDTHSSLFRVRHRDGAWLQFFTSRNVFKRYPNGEPWLILAASINISEPVQTGPQIDEILKENTRLKSQIITNTLTKREIEILKLITNGSSNRVLAKKLNISINTASTHRRNIMSKLKIKNTAQLVCFAIENGLN